MRILLALIICLLPISSSAKVFSLTTEHICGTKEKTEKFLTDIGRIPFIEADAMVLSASGEKLPSVMKIFVNPKDWTYAVMIANPDDSIWCILTEGKNFRAMTPGESI